MLDAHCHIDLYPKPEIILSDCEREGFPILSMTNLPSHFEKGYPFFKTLKKTRLALGMHPLYADRYEKEFPKFLNNLSKTSYIGEIGLDFSKEGISTKEIQIHMFEHILRVVADKKKLLSIHSRMAENEVLNLLKKYKINNVIFHWYTGALSLIDEIVQERYYFSVNSAMIKTELGRKRIQKIPPDKILTETDGPFTMENNLPTRPGQVQPIIEYLSIQWQMSADDVQKVVLANFANVISCLK